MSDHAATNAAASITGAAVTVFGSAAGVWASIAFCAAVGAMWSAAFAETKDKAHAAGIVARNALTACAITGPAAYLALECCTNMPAEYLFPATAFIIGAWFDQARGAVWGWIQRKIGGAS